MDDSQFIHLIDILKDIAENLRRIAFELEKINYIEEDNNNETV